MDYKQNSNCWYQDVCKKKADNCESSCIRYAEMLHLVENSGLPQNKWMPTVLEAGEDYEQFKQLARIKEDIVTLVNTGFNLYICSEETGNGKTSWSIKILLRYFNDIWAGNGFRVRGMFVHIPTLLLQLKNFNDPVSEEYKQNLLNCDIVVWDEIAYSGLSNYDYSNLLMFLEHRILSGRTNIFTSNCNSKEKLSQIVGAKLASRIWETSTIIEFKGKDRR